MLFPSCSGGLVECLLWYKNKHLFRMRLPISNFTEDIILRPLVECLLRGHGFESRKQSLCLQGYNCVHQLFHTWMVAVWISSFVWWIHHGCMHSSLERGPTPTGHITSHHEPCGLRPNDSCLEEYKVLQQNPHHVPLSFFFPFPSTKQQNPFATIILSLVTLLFQDTIRHFEALHFTPYPIFHLS